MAALDAEIAKSAEKTDAEAIEELYRYMGINDPNKVAPSSSVLVSAKDGRL